MRRSSRSSAYASPWDPPTNRPSMPAAIKVSMIVCQALQSMRSSSRKGVTSAGTTPCNAELATTSSYRTQVSCDSLVRDAVVLLPQCGPPNTSSEYLLLVLMDDMAGQ